jgi:hypothetical protein
VKNFACALLVSVLILSCFGFIGANFFRFAEGSTVSGWINQDTTWSKTNNPYTFTGDVYINSGVTLTIEPGTTVNMGNNCLQVNGTICARGTSTEPIYISGNTNAVEGVDCKIDFTQTSINWSQSTETGCIIENTVLRSVPILVEGNSPLICNNNILFDSSNVYPRAAVTVEDADPIIANNTVTIEGTNFQGRGIYVRYGFVHPIIANNTIRGVSCFVGCGIESIGQANISGNVITGWTCGISSVNDVITGNLIYSNNGTPLSQNSTCGIQLTWGTVKNNTIINNKSGVVFKGPSDLIGYGHAQTIVAYNNIYDNEYNAYNTISTNADATQNWWGTTVAYLINQTLYDSKYNPALGAILYDPYLLELNPQAPTASYDPNPSPLPTPTPPPTTPSPTNAPTSQATPTPKPTSPAPTPQPKTSPQLDLSCNSSTSYSDFSVEIIGSLKANSAGISDAQILLSYSVNAGNSWVDLTTTNTDANGDFLVVWRPQVTGNNLLKAVYLGNGDYSDVTKIINFAVTPYQEQNVFSVTSNSTVTSLFFNSTRQELSFTVEGSPGTTGYVNIYLPKSLISDVSSLAVYLDGVPLVYSILQQDDDSVLITFNYHHSIHQVAIGLNSPAEANSLNQQLIIVAAVFAVIAVAAAVLVICIKNRKKAPKN